MPHTKKFIKTLAKQGERSFLSLTKATKKVNNAKKTFLAELG